MGQPYHKERSATQKVRQSLSQNRTYHCKDCGKTIFLHGSIGDDRLVLHHVRPIVQGGITIKQNLVQLCDHCHYNRHLALRQVHELPLFHVSPQARDVVTNSPGLEILRSIRELLGQGPLPVKVKEHQSNFTLDETLSRIEYLLQTKRTTRPKLLGK